MALSDINLSNLEQKVNYQLQLIHQWLKRNKLTLNYSKTAYHLFNKQPHAQVCSKFRLHINKSLLERENAVKYLGVWIDNKLNWSAHIENLSLQLSKSCNTFFYLRDFMTNDTLTMLYYSLVYSHLIYGITAWGTAHQHKLREIEVKLNNIVCTITKNKKFSHITFFYKKINFLKLKDVCKLELANFIHKLFHNKLPNVFKIKFMKLINIHSHEIRKSNQSNYFLSRVNKITCQHKLNYRGVTLWNEIKDELNNKSFHQFKKQIKNLLIYTYATS